MDSPQSTLSSPSEKPQDRWVRLHRASSASEGRYAIAKDNIPAGTLVLASCPFALSFNINSVPAAYHVLQHTVSAVSKVMVNIREEGEGDEWNWQPNARKGKQKYSSNRVGGNKKRGSNRNTNAAFHPSRVDSSSSDAPSAGRTASDEAFVVAVAFAKDEFPYCGVQASSAPLSTFSNTVCFHCLTSTPRSAQTCLVNGKAMLRRLNERHAPAGRLFHADPYRVPAVSSHGEERLTLLQQLARAEAASTSIPHAVDEHEEDPILEVCVRGVHMYGCPECCVAVYCSRACMRESAKQHAESGECAVLRRIWLETCIAPHYAAQREEHAEKDPKECGASPEVDAEANTSTAETTTVENPLGEGVSDPEHNDEDENEGDNEKDKPTAKATKGEKRLALKKQKQMEKRAKKANSASGKGDAAATVAAASSKSVEPANARARKLTENDSVTMQLLTLVSLILVRGARLGYAESMARTPKSEDAAVKRASRREPDDNRSSDAGACDENGSEVASPEEGSAPDAAPTAAHLPPQEASTTDTRVKFSTESTVPKEVTNIIATRRKLGIVDTVEVVDGDLPAGEEKRNDSGHNGGGEGEGEGGVCTDEELRDDDSWASVARLVTNLSVIPKSELVQFMTLYHLFQKHVAPYFARLISKDEKTENSDAAATVVDPVAVVEADSRANPVALSFFQRVCAACKCNGFGVFNIRDGCIAIGLFPAASYWNHSCSPNLCRVMMQPQEDRCTASPEEGKQKPEEAGRGIDSTASAGPSLLPLPTYYQRLYTFNVESEQKRTNGKASHTNTSSPDTRCCHDGYSHLSPPSLYGRVASFFALHAVKKETPLTICYVEVAETTAERRRTLLLNYRFYCQCSRCNPVSSTTQHVSCSSCSEGQKQQQPRGLPAVPPLCDACEAKGYLRPLQPPTCDSWTANETSQLLEVSMGPWQAWEGECSVCRRVRPLPVV